MTMNRLRFRTGTTRYTLAASYAVGSFLGALLGSVSGFVDLAAASLSLERAGSGFPDFLAAFFLAAWPLLLALLFSTSTVGCYLIPALAMVRGFLVSCSLSVMLLSDAASAGLCLLIIGLPAFFSIPAFFLLAEDSVDASKVLRVCSGSALSRGCSPAGPRLFLAAALLFACVCTQRFLIPLFL